MSELKNCPLKMVEIYSGKNPDWKGWHNVLVGPEEIPIAGPVQPQLSKYLLEVVEAWNTRPDLKVELVEAIDKLADDNLRYTQVGDPIQISYGDVIEAINTIMGDTDAH